MSVPQRPGPTFSVSRWLYLWGPVVLVMSGIFVASSIRGLSTPVVSDKMAHYLVYAALGAVTLRAVAGAVWNRVTFVTGCLAVLICAAYAISDEVHQYFVPNRSAEILDVIADVSGAATSVLVLWAWSIIRRFLASSRPDHVLRQPDSRA